jgi:hypothetical protein
MAALIQTYKPKLERMVVVRKSPRSIKKLPVHRCVFVSVGLILAGLSIPMLMLLELLQASLTLAFVGLLLAATGGVLALIYYGEV